MEVKYDRTISINGRLIFGDTLEIVSWSYTSGGYGVSPRIRIRTP